MTRKIALISLVTLLAMVLAANAQGFGNGVGDGSGACQFVDEDGDGFNDLAPDADGDGIPNGLDPDYERPADGSGSQNAVQNGLMHRFGLLGDGEGLLAGFGKAEGGVNEGPGQGNAYGPGDGTGTGVGPADGTGFGPGDGSGDCDGSGTPGEVVQQRRAGRR